MWLPYFKLDTNGNPAQATTIFNPLVSSEGDLFCMDFSMNDFFFYREIAFQEKLSGYDWLPEVVDIDLENKKIIYKWYKQTCNHIIYSGKKLDDICQDWKTQLSNIINTLDSEGIYKPTLYPHCFYFDNNKKLHMTDYYACVEKSNPYINLNDVKHIISDQSKHRWAAAIEGDKVNFKTFTLEAMQKYIEWPDNALQIISSNIS